MDISEIVDWLRETAAEGTAPFLEPEEAALIVAEMDRLHRELADRDAELVLWRAAQEAEDAYYAYGASDMSFSLEEDERLELEWDRRTERCCEFRSGREPAEAVTDAS